MSAKPASAAGAPETRAAGWRAAVAVAGWAVALADACHAPAGPSPVVKSRAPAVVAVGSAADADAMPPATLPDHPAPAAPAEAGPPAVAGEPLQTWRVGDLDVVAAIPVGATSRRPVVVGIHGSRDTPASACARFRQTVAGWAFVVCPEGVPYRGGLAWGAPSVIAARIDAALAALRSHYGDFLADGPVVYAGWSLGATRGPGVVALRPGGFEPVVLAEAGHTRLDANASAKQLRAGKAAHAIIACATKRCAAFSKRLTTASKSGPSVSFVDAGIGRGHVFDDRMAHDIGGAIARAVANDPRWSGLEAALSAAPADSDAGAPLPEDEDDAEDSSH